jgi:cobalt/nickel transport system permease protein
MRKSLYFFCIVLLIIFFASFLASSNPDGLEFVAEQFGFISKEVGRTSLMTNYHIPFLGNTPLSTLLSGIAGILICLALFLSTSRVFFIISNNRSKSQLDKTSRL